MVTEVNSNTFASVYKDDFTDSDNFHRILFNSGRSLQARELTQMQTIIQREIERFGNNIFKDGAAVNPISANGVNPTPVQFIKLASSSNDFGGLSTTDIVGKYFVGSVSSVKLVVISAVAATATDPATLYVRYLETPDDNYRTAISSEILTEVSPASGRTLSVATSAATGQGFQITVGASDFYAAGHFVFAPNQTIILDKYNHLNIKKTIGYIVHEEIVTELDDDSLYDNQGVNPNRAAPGAHRYKIRLELADKTSVAAGQQFVPFLELVNGDIVAIKTGIEDYNKPDDLVAQRTREAEGNFLVTPFKVRMLPGDSEGNLFLEVDPFVAYVDGFRVVGGTGTSSRPAYDIPKPQSVTPSSDYNTTPLSTRITLRNYLELDSTTGFNNYSANPNGLFDSASLINSSGHVIGNTKIMQYESVGNRYYAYLFNTNMYDGKSIRDVDFIGDSASGTNRLNVQLDSDGRANLLNAGGYNCFVSLLKARIQAVSDVTFEVQRETTAVASNPGGVISITSPNDQPFEDEDNWILIDVDNSQVIPYSTWGIHADTEINVSGTGGANPYRADIGGLTPDGTYLVIHFVDKTDADYIPKTLTTSTISSGSLVESDGLQYVDLNDIDIFAIDSVKDSANGVIDLKNRFGLDNGMRDNSYIPGRLLLKGNIPVENVYVKYRHFTHGAGDYYSIASYDNASFLQDPSYAYADVPTHTVASGETIRLADLLDFRSTYDRQGNITRTVEVPRNRSNLSYNMSSYNGRVDVLVANRNKTVYVKRGIESLEPTAPTVDQKKELPLYYFNYGPNTLDPKDLRTRQMSHKRFSYKSITDLEKRLKRLEETVSLSLLETKTKDLVITNDDGVVRAKAGFFVDNFQYWHQGVASETSPNYNPNAFTQFFDPIRSLVWPKKKLDHLDLKYDFDRSTATELKVDTVYLQHKETSRPVYEQLDMTGAKNVNPFLTGLNVGSLTISPDQDEWLDSKNLPTNVLPERVRLASNSWSAGSSQLYGYNADDFVGASTPGVIGESLDISDPVPGETLSDQAFVGQTRNRTDVEISIQTQTTDFTKVTDRITDITLIGPNEVGVTRIQYSLPFIRARKIYFRAETLKPNTRHYPYFNGVPVAQWCREEAQWFGAGNRPEADDQYDEVTPDLSEHPDGQTTLTSDTFGTIIGSFFLPNTGDVPQQDARTGSSGTVYGGASGAPSTILETDALATYEDRLAVAVQRAGVGGGTGIDAVKSAAIYNAVGWRFRAGSALKLEILDTPTYDLNNAFSRCEAAYTTLPGELETEQSNVRTTRRIQIERDREEWSITEPTGVQLVATPAPVDPIAQTFYVYDRHFPQGMYVNSIDVYLYSAPPVGDATENEPITCEIRNVRDGVPVSQAIHATAITSRSAADVRSIINADANGVTGFTTRAQVLAAPVKFTFAEPVFLEAGAYYSFVLKAPKTDKYQAFITTVGEYQYGSNSDRVSGNNIDGSLFESQNASTWSPLQNSDMAYRVNHLRFKPTGTARFINKKLPRHTFGYPNALTIDSGSSTLYVAHPGHGFFPGDEPKIRGLDSATKYAGIFGSSIMNNLLAVDSVDALGYTLVLDSAATDSASFGPSTLTVLKNFNYEEFKITLTSPIEPDHTSIGAAVKLVSGQSYANNVDTRFNQDPSFTNTPINALVHLTEPKLAANDSAENENSWGNSSSPGGASFMLNMSMSAKNSSNPLAFDANGAPLDLDSANDPFTKTTSPAINAFDVMIHTGSNLIDNQGPIANIVTKVNAALEYEPETNPLSGSTPSKHITKPVIITEPAIGLKILFDAYRPPEAEFEVYYRVCQADENIYDFSWTLVEPVENGYPSAHSVITNLKQLKTAPYEYFAGDETGVTVENDITSFTQFQVKIVMKSKNSAQIPCLSNIRVISLVT